MMWMQNVRFFGQAAKEKFLVKESRMIAPLV
jgi:hypothetical protein